MVSRTPKFLKAKSGNRHRMVWMVALVEEIHFLGKYTSSLSYRCVVNLGLISAS